VAEKFKWGYVECKPTEAVKSRNGNRLFIVILRSVQNGYLAFISIRLWTNDIEKALKNLCSTPRTEEEIKEIEIN